MGQMPKPDVDLISGLSPSISISQKSSGNNPRSTVGTITEIYDFLRVLFARVGQGYCPQMRSTNFGSVARSDHWQHPATEKGNRATQCSRRFIRRSQKGEHRDLLIDLQKQGYVRVRVDGEVVSTWDPICKLDRTKRHNIELVTDRLVEIKRRHSRSRLVKPLTCCVEVGQVER